MVLIIIIIINIYYKLIYKIFLWAHLIFFCFVFFAECLDKNVWSYTSYNIITVRVYILIIDIDPVFFWGIKNHQTLQEIKRKIT